MEVNRREKVATETLWSAFQDARKQEPRMGARGVFAGMLGETGNIPA